MSGKVDQSKHEKTLSERENLAKENAMLKKKIKEMERTMTEWNPATIKTEINNLCVEISKKTDYHSPKFFDDLGYVIQKVAIWSKQDRTRFFDFLKKLCLALDGEKQTRKILEPISNMFRRFEVDTALIARMKSDERKGHDILSLWTNDILRCIGIIKEIDLSWSEHECLDLAKQVNVKIAKKLWTMKELVNFEIKQKCQEVSHLLLQVGLGLRECMAAYDKNQLQKLNLILDKMNEHIEGDTFNHLSLAIEKIVGQSEMI